MNVEIVIDELTNLVLRFAWKNWRNQVWKKSLSWFSKEPHKIFLKVILGIGFMCPDQNVLYKEYQTSFKNELEGVVQYKKVFLSNNWKRLFL